MEPLLEKGWLTIREVVQRTGKSESSIFKYVKGRQKDKDGNPIFPSGRKMWNSERAPWVIHESDLEGLEDRLRDIGRPVES